MKKNPFFKTIPYKKALALGPRRFVKEYLFPAMRREHGNGFAMTTWYRNTTESGLYGLDYIARQEPACHSVMCIGGTMELITGGSSAMELSRLLGLPFQSDDFNNCDNLFYNWLGNIGPWKGLSRAFHAANTPREKEKIAEKAVMAAVRMGEKLKK